MPQDRAGHAGTKGAKNPQGFSAQERAGEFPNSNRGKFDPRPIAVCQSKQGLVACTVRGGREGRIDPCLTLLSTGICLFSPAAVAAGAPVLPPCVSRLSKCACVCVCVWTQAQASKARGCEGRGEREGVPSYCTDVHGEPRRHSTTSGLSVCARWW